jgi:hypothetical protein
LSQTPNRQALADEKQPMLVLPHPEEEEKK